MANRSANSSAELWVREPTATTSAPRPRRASAAPRSCSPRSCRSRRCPSESAGLTGAVGHDANVTASSSSVARGQHEVEPSRRHHRAEVVVLGGRPSRQPVRAIRLTLPLEQPFADARRSACRAAPADRGGRAARVVRCRRPPTARPVTTVQRIGSRRSGTMSASQSSASQSKGCHSACPCVRSAWSTSRWRRQSMTWLARSVGVRWSHRSGRPSGVELVALDHRDDRRRRPGRVERPRDRSRRASTFPEPLRPSSATKHGVERSCAHRVDPLDQLAGEPGSPSR